MYHREELMKLYLEKDQLLPTELRLSRYSGQSERFWLNLQMRYNIEVEKERLKNHLDKEVVTLAS